MTPAQLVQFIESRRLPLTNEKPLQRALADELFKTGHTFNREVDLGAGDIIDFMLYGIGLEVKLKGQRRGIYRQCKRYCDHDEVQALVLATNAPMGMPKVINNKPVLIAKLGKAWL